MDPLPQTPCSCGAGAADEGLAPSASTPCEQTHKHGLSAFLSQVTNSITGAQLNSVVSTASG